MLSNQEVDHGALSALSLSSSEVVRMAGHDFVLQLLQAAIWSKRLAQAQLAAQFRTHSSSSLCLLVAEQFRWQARLSRSRMLTSCADLVSMDSAFPAWLVRELDIVRSHAVAAPPCTIISDQGYALRMKSLTTPVVLAKGVLCGIDMYMKLAGFAHEANDGLYIQQRVFRPMISLPGKMFRFGCTLLIAFQTKTNL